MKTVIEIVADYLKYNELDGLQNGAECGCSIDDLAPCGEIQSSCSTGYKVDVPVGVECEFDFYICENKDDKPWQE